MLTLQSLGTPQILFDSVPVVLPFKRAEALLYYLAAERSATRQEHIALLWESDDETKGRKNLRHALYTLKKERADHAVPTTDWGSSETLEHWRQAWADLCNAKFAEKELPYRIDHRSYERQGVDLLPTVHEGPTVRAMEGCYVATAVYGSYDCPQVWTLRRFRDYSLANTWYGRTFIRVYYATSPTLVKWFGHTEWFKKFWKSVLDKMVLGLNNEGFEDTPYEDRPW